MECFKTLPSLCTTARIKPDLTIYDSSKDEVLVQVEVESNVRKLQFGLVHQLHLERNRDDTVTTCTGFYFPYTVARHVVEVKVTWSDDRFSFIASRTHLEKDDVLTNVQNVVNQQLSKLDSLGYQGRVYSTDLLTLPLSRQFISCHFGEEANQVPSGLSVVIISEPKKEVYKVALEASGGKELTKLLHVGPLSHSSLPKGFKPYQAIEFFIFPLHYQPMVPSHANNHLVWLVDSVHDALEELHSEAGRAHLDVGLPNICFEVEEDDTRAMLIDPDRCQQKDVDTSHVRDVYGKSIMYTWPDGTGLETA